ncbi:MAG: hypothetical protein AABX39_02030 [Nanoarchaeota archaeon]
MNNPKYKNQKIDLIETSVANFILVDDGNNGKNIIAHYPVEYTKINELCEKYIEELAAKHPEFYLEPFNIKYLVSESFEGGKLEEYVKKERINEFARKVQQFRDERKDIFARLEQLVSQEDRDSYARNHFLSCVFDQVLRQHGNNIYSCENNFSPNCFNIKGEIIKIADDSTMANNGHGDFEIRVFKILSKSQKNKEPQLYQVHTLELEQINSITGQGCYCFEDEFR